MFTVKNDKFKKRILSTILVLLLPVCLLTGCGDVHSDRLVLALRAGTYAEVVKACLPEFEQKTGITCEVLEFSEEDLRNIVLNDSVRKNGMYDLCMVEGSWVMEYVYEGVLADIGNLGYTLDDDIIGATTAICVQNGKTYLAPYYGNVTVLMYNYPNITALGYDSKVCETLDELLEAGRRASKSGYGGFVYRGDTENDIVVDFLPVLCAFGGWVVDDNNRPTVNTPEFQAAMEYYIELVRTGGQMSKEQIISSIEEGKAAISVGWPGWYSKDNKNTDYIPFPGKVHTDSESYDSNILGIWALGVPENSTNKQMAVELLKHLMDKEVQKKTVELGGVPCRYSILQDPEILKIDPHFDSLCDALESGVYRPLMLEWTQFYTILGNEMKSILNGERSVEEGLRIAQNELVRLMNRN